MNGEYTLTDMERKVITALAIYGPLSGYDFHLGGRRERGKRKALMSSSYWNTVRESLGVKGKNLIEPVSLRGRGRKKTPYWLTMDGVVVAIAHKIDLDILKANYEKVSGKGEPSDFLFDFAKAFPNKIGQVYDMFKSASKGQLAISYIPINDKELEKFIRITLKYPMFRKALRKSIDHANKVFREMLKTEKE